MLFSVCQAQPESNYVGSDKCGLCHSGIANGNIMEKWSSGPHANAFKSLATERANSILTEKYGLIGNPQEEVLCLSCHLTGFEGKSSSTNTIHQEEGVSCEACHGAGKLYAKEEIMRNRELSIQNGLTELPKYSCKQCHNEKGHSTNIFSFESSWPEIQHMRNYGNSNPDQTQKESTPGGTSTNLNKSPSSTEMMHNGVPALPTPDPSLPQIEKPAAKKKKK